MKKLKFFAMMLAFIAGSLAFSSCNKDDDGIIDDGQYTFDPYNAHYLGKTRASFIMGLQQLSYTTESTHWTIVINPKTQLANVTIHNAKFAQQMPAIGMMVLENLAYNPVTDVITGRDITPKVYEGGEWTPYEDFPFNGITVTYNNPAHSSVNISFEVDITMSGAGGNGGGDNGEESGSGMPDLPGAGTTMTGTGTFTGTGIVGPCEQCN